MLFDWNRKALLKAVGKRHSWFSAVCRIWTFPRVKDMAGNFLLPIVESATTAEYRESLVFTAVSWLSFEPPPRVKDTDGNISTALIGSDSREFRNGFNYCRFWVLSSSNCSRLSWFRRIRLLSSGKVYIKITVLSKAFALTTVSSGKSCLWTTVWKFLFLFSTVILCFLDSRKHQKHDVNC